MRLAPFKIRLVRYRANGSGIPSFVHIVGFIHDLYHLILFLQDTNSEDLAFLSQLFVLLLHLNELLVSYLQLCLQSFDLVVFLRILNQFGRELTLYLLEPILGIFKLLGKILVFLSKFLVRLGKFQQKVSVHNFTFLGFHQLLF